MRTIINEKTLSNLKQGYGNLELPGGAVIHKVTGTKTSVKLVYSHLLGDKGRESGPVRRQFRVVEFDKPFGPGSGDHMVGVVDGAVVYELVSIVEKEDVLPEKDRVEEVVSGGDEGTP